jgi:hypothetical protein
MNTINIILITISIVLIVWSLFLIFVRSVELIANTIVNKRFNEVNLSFSLWILLISTATLVLNCLL